MPFPYKTVLITGATAGIGLAFAERMLASDPALTVIAVGRQLSRLDDLITLYGASRVIPEALDVSDLEAIPAWAARIVAAHPRLDCVILNAGFQRSLDFTRGTPSSVHSANATPEAATSIAAAAEVEMRTNYLSPLATVAAFLPHLTSLGPGTPAAVMLVSSGAAVVPMARCPNYCASKAALHSFAWSLRAQLSAPNSPDTHHIRVVEILPPAVQSELHSRQPDLVAIGHGNIGVPLDEYADETWALLKEESSVATEDGRDPDEIWIKLMRDRFGSIEAKKKDTFDHLVKMLRG